MAKERFSVIIEEGEDGYLIGEVVELPGCRTQAKNLDQLMMRIREVIQLYLKTKSHTHPHTRFIGVQQVVV